MDTEGRLTVDREVVAELLTDLAGLALALKHVIRSEQGVSAAGLRKAAAHMHELHARIVEDVYGIRAPEKREKPRSLTAREHDRGGDQ